MTNNITGYLVNLLKHLGCIYTIDPKNARKKAHDDSQLWLLGWRNNR
jgi:hypothetical protein